MDDNNLYKFRNKNYVDIEQWIVIQMKTRNGIGELLLKQEAVSSHRIYGDHKNKIEVGCFLLSKKS